MEVSVDSVIKNSFCSRNYDEKLEIAKAEKSTPKLDILSSKLRPAVSSVVKRTLSVREVWGSIPRPVKSTQCRQRLATVATFLRSCVAQALSRGDGPRNSLHASA